MGDYEQFQANVAELSAENERLKALANQYHIMSATGSPSGESPA